MNYFSITPNEEINEMIRTASELLYQVDCYTMNAHLRPDEYPSKELADMSDNLYHMILTLGDINGREMALKALDHVKDEEEASLTKKIEEAK